MNGDEVSDKKPTREELLGMLDNMIMSYEDLPPLAMSTSITHYDMLSLMMLLLSILKTEE